IDAIPQRLPDLDVREPRRLRGLRVPTDVRVAVTGEAIALQHLSLGDLLVVGRLDARVAHLTGQQRGLDGGGVRVVLDDELVDERLAAEVLVVRLVAYFGTRRRRDPDERAHRTGRC